MTHLIKRLVQNTSLPVRWETCHERCVRRLFTTRKEEMEADKSASEKKSVKKQRKGFQPIKLRRETLRKLRSVTGVSVTPFSVGWAKMDLTDMKLVTYESKDVKIKNVDSLETSAYKEAKIIKDLIPESDLYIMERCLYFRKPDKEFQFKLLVSSMIAALLYDTASPIGEDNVQFQNPFAIDFKYKLLVDKERVSAGQMLQRMLDRTTSDSQSVISVTVENVTFLAEKEIVKSMFSSNPTTRDASAIALFIVLSFITNNPIENPHVTHT